MRSFASDNNASVHPLVMEALMAANADHAVGYGDDPWTERSSLLLREEFGGRGDVYFVFNGTGANSVAIQAAARSFDAVIAPSTGHICVDECGAPSRMSGARIFEVDCPDGKLTVEGLSSRIVGVGVCHHSQPRVAYISQVSELGTVYTVEEVRSLADYLHSRGMYLHMDGARLANACAYLGCSMAEITVDAGVDILSFGGTKNGMMIGEAVISFNPSLSLYLEYIRKQSAQLCSKMRYLSSQFVPYLTDGLWLENARWANSMARELADRLAAYECVSFTQKVESNALFFTIPRSVADSLLEQYFFYFWNESTCEVRLVTSWDTTQADVDSFMSTFALAVERL